MFKTLLRKPENNTKKVTGQRSLIVDVRTPFEFKHGHVHGSKNIPLDTLSSKIEELKKLNRKIITVCRSGARSASAKQMLLAAGIDAYDGGPWQNLK